MAQSGGKGCRKVSQSEEVIVGTTSTKGKSVFRGAHVVVVRWLSLGGVVFVEGRFSGSAGGASSVRGALAWPGLVWSGQVTMQEDLERIDGT